MKKIHYFLVLIALVLASCGSKETTKEELSKQLMEKKKEITNLNLEIQKIQSKLDTLGVEIMDENKVLVKTKTITPKEFNHYITISGTLESDLDAFISPEINGQISKIYVKEGDNVNKGDKLLQLKTEVTKKSIAELRTSLELAKTLFEKQKSLWDKGIGSEIEYLQSKNNKESLENKLETLNEQLDMATITAPYDGVVEEVYQKIGEIASPGRQVILLINLDKLKVNADISENYIPYLNIGDEVVLKFPTYPDVSLKEEITNIGKVINPNNRTVDLLINVDNASGKLLPNMMSNVVINDYHSDSALIVPSIVLKNDVNKGDFVYVAENTENGMITTKKYIDIGKSYLGNVEIIKGLKKGDKVIIKGHNVVKNGTHITE